MRNNKQPQSLRGLKQLWISKYYDYPSFSGTWAEQSQTKPHGHT